MTDHSAAAVPVWTLATGDVQVPAVSEGVEITAERLGELRSTLASLAAHPIATLEAHPLPQELDRSRGRVHVDVPRSVDPKHRALIADDPERWIGAAVARVADLAPAAIAVLRAPGDARRRLAHVTVRAVGVVAARRGDTLPFSAALSGLAVIARRALWSCDARTVDALLTVSAVAVILARGLSRAGVVRLILVARDDHREEQAKGVMRG